jgi:hypothetical protein
LSQTQACRKAEYCKLLTVRVLRHIPPSAYTAYGTEGICSIQQQFTLDLPLDLQGGRLVILASGPTPDGSLALTFAANWTAFSSNVPVGPYISVIVPANDPPRCTR